MADAGTAFVDVEGRFEKLLEGTEAAAEGVSSKFESVFADGGAGLERLGAGVAAVTLGVTAIGAKFEHAFAHIRTETGETGASLEGLEDAFRNVVSSVPTDFGLAADAVSELHRQLDLTGTPLEERSKQLLELSRITGTDLAGNIKASSQVLQNWSVDARDQGETLDLLFRATQKTGIGFAELSELVTTGGPLFRALGFDISHAAAFIGTLEKNGIAAGPVLGALNRSIKDAAGLGLDATGALNLYIDSIKNAGSAAEATGIAIDVFGPKAGPKLAQLIREGKLSYDELAQSISNGHDTILKAGEDAQTLADKWDLFKNRMLLEVEPAANVAFGAVDGLFDLFNQLPQAGQNAIVFGAAAAFGFSQVSGVVANIVQAWPAFAGILSAMPAAFGPVGIAAAAVGVALAIAFDATPVNNFEVALEGSANRIRDIILQDQDVSRNAAQSWVEDYLKRQGTLNEFNRVLSNNNITVDQFIDALFTASDGTGQWVNQLGLGQTATFNLMGAIGGLDVAFRQAQISALDSAKAHGDLLTISGIYEQALHAEGNAVATLVGQYGQQNVGLAQLKPLLDDTARAGQAAADATLAQTGSMDAANFTLAVYRNKLSDTLVFLGYSREKADELAAALINLGEQHPTPTVDVNPAPAHTKIGVVKAALDAVDRMHPTPPISATDKTGPGVSSAKANIDSVQGKTVDIWTIAHTIQSPWADGGINFFADGGSENHVAQIAPAGAMRVWAEPETGGEAYIPLAGSKRARSLAIMDTVEAMFGRTAVPMADGGTLGGRRAGRAVIENTFQMPVGFLDPAAVEKLNDELEWQLRGLAGVL